MCVVTRVARARTSTHRRASGRAEIKGLINQGLVGGEGGGVTLMGLGLGEWGEGGDGNFDVGR